MAHPIDVVINTIYETALEETVAKNLIRKDENGTEYMDVNAVYEAYANNLNKEELSDLEKNMALLWASSQLDTSRKIKIEPEKDDEVEKDTDEDDDTTNDTDTDDTDTDTDDMEDDTEEKEWSVEIFEKSEEKQLIYGAVYSPDQVDAQDDSMNDEEIEKMAHFYLEKHLKNILPANDLRHTQDLPLEKVCPVESYIAPVDIPVNENRVIIKGSWIMVSKVFDPTIWQEVKKGNINAYSMKGKGRRIPVEE